MKYVKQKKLGFIISAILGAQAVYALPQGAQVVQGSASFSVSNSSIMNITNSNNAVINWQQFNIGAGQTTNFIQPSSASSVLNRVISNNPSQILGNLNSNGQVFLINQHGILVGEGARINTNGFFASTLNITNENFLNGNLTFSEGGLGDINNKGYIHAGEDGNVVLIAPNIENGGVIEVDSGNIILAAGESITITSLDNSSIEFQVQAPENSVTNLGSLIAKNGAASLFAGTLKHSGIIRATGLVRDADGIIRLVALNKTEVSGSVDVSGEQAGSIEILGDIVDIQQGANINASGSISAGEILIGGDQQGLNPNIKNATSTTVATGAQVSANGVGKADGGRVIFFAKNDVHIQGDISATGGNIAGDGGFIETSGLKQLDITAIPDASATNGEAGEWLIDPNNIIIASTGNVNTNITTTVGVGKLYDTANDSAVLSTETIVAALDLGTNVTIRTGTLGVNTEQGDITINDAIAPVGSTLGDLTLNAHNDINVNADIGAGAMTLTADSDGLGGGVINLGNTILNTGFNNLTLSGNAINVNGNTTISNNNSLVTLNAPLTIASAANLTFVNNGFTVSTTVINNGGITNNGAITINNNCGDGCSIISINGVIENNGAIDFIGGELASTGTLNLNAGTALNAASPFQGSYSRLTAAGTLNPNVSVIADPDLELGLSNGIINNFENIKISNSFNIDGGTINFGVDINLPQSLTTNISNTLGALTLSGPTSGAYFTLNGPTNFSITKGNFDIVLSNTNLVNANDWSVNGFSFGNGVSAGITGTNSSFSLLNDSRLIFNAPLNHSISVPVISQGTIELVNAASNLSFTGLGGLTLKSGGRLSGFGTYTGNVIVDQGGQISPGLYGNTRDNTGILNIVGNVNFNAGSVGIWEIDDDGINFDQLNVTGNVSIDSADIFLFWDTLALASPTIQGVFSLIQATGAIAQTTPILHDLPSVTNSSIAITVGNGSALQYSPGIAGTINRWTGASQITPTLWSNSANWSSGVPTLGQTLVIETATTIDLSVATASLGDVQLDANLNVNASGSLNGAGVLSNLQDIRLLTSTSDVSGTGTWNNLLAVFAEDAITITRNTFNNYGGFNWSTPNSTVADLVFTGTSFNNRGTVNFIPLNNGNVVDFSGSANGLNNQGLTIFNIGAVSTSFTGTLNNVSGGVLSVVSPNTGAALNLATSNTNNGEIFLKDTKLSLNSGVTLSLTSSSSLAGSGTYTIGAGSILQADNVIFGSGLAVYLSGGTLRTTSSIAINDVFNWSAGTLEGNTTGALTTGTLAITTLGSSVDTTMSNVNWTNNGHVDWLASGGDFVINNAIFTNSPLALGTFSIKTTSNNSGIIGNGTFNNQGHMEVNAATTATITDIGVTFNHSAGGIQTGLELLVSGHTLSLSGTTNVTGVGEINFASGSVLSIVNGGVLNLNSTSVILGSSPSNFAGPTAGSLEINTGGTLNVLQTPSLFNIYNVLNLNGGTLDITNNLPLPNIMNWAGGKISGSGTLTIPAITTVNITASNAPVTLDAVSIINNGTMTYSAGNDLNDLYLNNAATLTNTGTFNFQNSTGGADVNSNAGIEGSFINNGIINVAQPSSTNNIDFWVPFTSSGIINIADGKFFELNDASVLSGAVNTNNSGTFSIGSSGVGILALSGTPSISGSGVFKIGSSLGSSVPSIFDVSISFTLPAAMTLDLHRGGEIKNASNLILPNTLNWTGGKIIGSGLFNIPAATTVNMTGTTGDMYIDGSTPNTIFTLQNNGTVNFTSANSSNDFRVDNKAVWVNGGTLNLMNASNGATITGLSGANGSFVNDTTGIINSAPSATLSPTLSIFIPFDNKGTINVASNTAFETNDIIADSGAIVIESGGVFQIDRNINSQGISNSRLTLSGTPTISGSGTFVVDDGAFFDVAVPVIFDPNLTLTLQGTGEIQNANNLTLGNTFNWNGGAVSGASGQVFTTSATSIINMNAATADMALSAIDMVTNGIVNYSSNNNNFILSNNASWTNAGTLNIPTNASITEISSANSSLVNSGTLNYSGTSLMSIATNFVSTGIMNINSGNIELPSTATFSGNTNIASGSILGFSGGSITDVSFLSGAKFSGLGSIVSTANVLIAESVSMPQSLTINGGAVSFEGEGILSTLNLNLGVINVDTLGASSVGDVLTVANLNWSSGAISGDGSASLVTTGNSSLLSGDLIDIDWSNQGKLVWQGTDTEVLNMSNASLTNAASGVINIRNEVSLSQNARNGFGQLKSISGGSGVFINDGTLNLINANLNLNGATLLLGSNTSVLNGSGTITGNVANPNGLISIGNPLDLSTSGAMTIDGNYTQGANGALEIRIVDPVNGQFSFDTFAVKGVANLDGELRIAYYSNQIVSITESFNPFVFANRKGEFSSLVDSNGSILAIDFSNGGFTILGTSSLLIDAVTIQTILQNQDKVERLLAIIEKEELSESLAFINETINEADEDEKKAKKRGPRLVCR